MPADRSAGNISFDIKDRVTQAVFSTPVFDIHTHLFSPEFGRMNLWGIDELLNYHYLTAEFFRYSATSYEDFWNLEKSARSELIWQTLFVENTPMSEATRGVVAVLNALKLDPNAKDLGEYREYFSELNYEQLLNDVLRICGASDVVMTNDPLDAAEVTVWKSGVEIDPRFHASMRLDRFLNDWKSAVPLIKAQGFDVSKDLDEGSIVEMRRFVNYWIEKMKPVYLGVSLPSDFMYPDKSTRTRLLQKVILPACEEHSVPLSLMIGVRRKMNPSLKLAGDGLGRADVSALSNICGENPKVLFLSTFLSRENQHELCVVARKFKNLTPFGCWWFLNNSSIIGEITRERIELLGTSFIPQHSDARILDQLIYKWSFSRRVIADILTESYRSLEAEGWNVSNEIIDRDVTALFSQNFRDIAGS